MADEVNERHEEDDAEARAKEEGMVDQKQKWPKAELVKCIEITAQDRENAADVEAAGVRAGSPGSPRGAGIAIGTTGNRTLPPDDGGAGGMPGMRTGARDRRPAGRRS